MNDEVPRSLLASNCGKSGASLCRLSNTLCLTGSTPREQPPHHACRQAPSKIARGQSATGQVGGLAELVAPRKGESVGDSEHECDR